MSRVIYKDNIRASAELAAYYRRLLEIVCMLLDRGEESDITMELLDLATSVQESIGTLNLTRNEN